MRFIPYIYDIIMLADKMIDITILLFFLYSEISKNPGAHAQNMVVSVNKYIVDKDAICAMGNTSIQV